MGKEVEDKDGDDNYVNDLQERYCCIELKDNHQKINCNIKGKTKA